MSESHWEYANALMTILANAVRDTPEIIRVREECAYDYGLQPKRHEEEHRITVFIDFDNYERWQILDLLNWYREAGPVDAMSNPIKITGSARDPESIADEYSVFSDIFKYIIWYDDAIL